MTRAYDYYPRSAWDRPANRGKPGAWMIFMNFGGYARAKKIRKHRSVLKKLGRRIERRRRNRGDL